RGPGSIFFNFLKAELGELPIIAEDLGVITDEVKELRDEFNFPGMKILQFAFDSENNQFLPHNYDTENCIVYTGTHDNNTTLGWYNNDATENDKNNVSKFTDYDGDNISWSLIKMAMKSKAMWSIIPMQDILNLDESARMNLPGKAEGNWKWKLENLNIDDEIKNKLNNLTKVTNRN
ncbi:MAG: 4-alpha-glucanotransferase, partial [Candidatus Marinimicrobia bacterium]|nr:4-alpha-glucanotransferase [Candidatus Neomarinimicrobiota bacterium]